jgi:hypothetical protein
VNWNICVSVTGNCPSFDTWHCKNYQPRLTSTALEAIQPPIGTFSFLTISNISNSTWFLYLKVSGHAFPLAAKPFELGKRPPGLGAILHNCEDFVRSSQIKPDYRNTMLDTVHCLRYSWHNDVSGAHSRFKIIGCHYTHTIFCTVKTVGIEPETFRILG